MSSARFAALVAQQPENEMFRFSLAQALLREQQAEAAVPHLEYCANKKVDWMMARIVLGKTLLSLGRGADAKPWLEQALHLAIEQSHEDPEHELRAILAELK